MTKPTEPRRNNNDAALAAFVAKKAEIDEMLARLQAHSDDHFGVDPDEVNYGHVGMIAGIADDLKHITDIAFREGEYAG